MGLFAIVAATGVLATFDSFAQETGVITAPVAPPSRIQEMPQANVPQAPPISAAPQAAPVSPAMPSTPTREIPAPRANAEMPVWSATSQPSSPLTQPAMQSASAASIALILPQRTEAYSSAAQTLRAGFMAAAKAAQAEDSCVVIEHEAGQVAYAFDEAQRTGARVIVGPLLRDDLRMLLRAPPTAWTVALTQLEDLDAALPNNIFPLTLTVESDARLLARELFINGHTEGLVLLTGETPLMKRFSDALVDEWLRLGEAPPQRVVFDAAEVAELKEKLSALSPRAIVLAVEGNDAALARAQTKAWPTYASGHIYQRASQFEGFAFEQLRVVEIPWLIEENARRFGALGIPPETPVTARLYALGYDAFQVATAFLGGPPLSLDINGASGHIRFDPKEGLLRTGQIAVFSDGRLHAQGASVQ